MKKQTFTLEKYIDTTIKAGDSIRVFDGSAFTPLNHIDEEYYIVLSYPELTGINAEIENIVGEVIFTGIENSICMGVLGTVYQQDLIIQIGHTLFRTCSKFVQKVNLSKDTVITYIDNNYYCIPHIY